MNTVLGVIVGLFQAAVSFLGLGQHGVTVPTVQPQAVAQQTIAVSSTSPVASSVFMGPAAAFCTEYATLKKGDTDATTGGAVSKLQQFLGISPTTGTYGALTGIGYTNKCVGGNAQPTSVAGMSKYTDSNFGFSFWYPSSAQVSVQPIKNSQQYVGGVITKQLQIQYPEGGDMTIQEFHSTNGTITLPGSDAVCPADLECSTRTYAFSSTLGEWTVSFPDHPDQGTRAADISQNTMGGLHMLAGNVRFGYETIVPLSANNFLVISADMTSDVLQTHLASTIVATDPTVAIPVSTAQQTATIEAEASAYGVNGGAVPISVPSQQSAALKTYSDSQNGFSIQYPSTLTIHTTNLMQDNSFSTDPTTDPSAQTLLSITSGPESLTIWESPDPTDVGNCMVAPQSQEQAVSKFSTVQINGVSFLRYSIGSVATGHVTDDEIYHTIKNSACWAIVTETNSTASNRLSASDAQDQQDSLNAAEALIDPIVQSFTFTANASASTPPTCWLKTDAVTYNLGDVINLTWASNNATRALWYQPVEQGSGLRKLIVPPTGTPGTSGAAPTVANVTGYQSITMQVVGPGGFGTCSTQVSVKNSNAKPSITIDNASLVGLKANGPNITINGTATNGALLNDAVNLVLFDTSYTGPFDQASIYAYAFANPKSVMFYSGGNSLDLRADSVPFENWSVRAYAPDGITRVRVLAYPFFSSSVNSRTQPLANVVLNLSQ